MEARSAYAVNQLWLNAGIEIVQLRMYLDRIGTHLDKLQVSNLLHDVKNRLTDLNSKLRHLELETKFLSIPTTDNTIPGVYETLHTLRVQLTKEIQYLFHALVSRSMAVDSII